jgi:hypothetical protein
MPLIKKKWGKLRSSHYRNVCPRIPWELVADPFGSVERTLGTAGLVEVFTARYEQINVVETSRAAGLISLVLQGVQVEVIM